MERHSFVIPAYKESQYLESCIISLLNQTVESRIVICTSTPNKFIETIARKYQLDYIVNGSEQIGIASDWNFALSNANTALVTIAHQDDIYEPCYVENIIAQIDCLKSESVLMAFTHYNDLTDGFERKISLNAIVKRVLLFPFLFKNNIQSIFFKKALLAFGDPIGCPTVTLNMSVLQDFSFSSKYNCVLDWFAWYELASREGSFVFVKQALVKHRIHINSETTHQINTGKRKKEELEIFTMIWGKPFAQLLTAIYAWGHKQNEV